MTFDDRLNAAVDAMFAANSSHAAREQNVRLVPDTRITALVAELEHLRPRTRTHERPQRLVLHPAPWVRKMVGGRAG